MIGATPSDLAAEIVGTPAPAADMTMGLQPTGILHGVVTAHVVGPPATLSLTLGGNPTPISGVRYYAGYVPTVNDTVIVIVSGEDKWVLGKLQP